MPADLNMYDALCTDANRLGSEHGSAAASWYFDGNTPEHVYRSVLIGLEDGDPAIYDTFPSAPLSGEFADEPTPASVLAELGVDEDDDAADDYLRMYEDGFAVAVADEIERAARAQVFAVEPYAWPGGYPIGYLTDDGEFLCAKCINDPTNPVHLSGNNDGWKWIGEQVLEGSAEDYDGAVVCAHCGAVLVEPDDDDNDVRGLARAMAARFTRKTRDDGSEFTALTDAADEWMRDVVREAHADMFPNDWRYDAIASAVEFIADEEDYDDRIDEWVDGACDMYSSDLIAWLASSGYREGYVQEARDEFGDAGESIYDEIVRGQWVEAREVFGLVERALEERC